MNQLIDQCIGLAIGDLFLVPINFSFLGALLKLVDLICWPIRILTARFIALGGDRFWPALCLSNILAADMDVHDGMFT